MSRECAVNTAPGLSGMRAENPRELRVLIPIGPRGLILEIEPMSSAPLHVRHYRLLEPGEGRAELVIGGGHNREASVPFKGEMHYEGRFACYGF